MAYTDKNLEIYEDPQPFLSLLKLVGIVAAALFISMFFSQVIMTLWGIEMSEVLSAYRSPFDFPELKSFFMTSQAVTASMIFIIAPLIYLYQIEKKSINSLSLKQPFDALPLILTIFIMISAMVSMEFIIRWNQNLDFPDFLAGLERWAKEEEEMRKKLTEFLTQFNSVGEFLVGLIVIAVLAAVGEELLFRGLIQNKVHAITKNIHVAIWITGLLFSLFHLQLYGLFPRMLLGVLFGYIYHWSKNLAIPIFAHFVNNGLGVLLIYLHQVRFTDEDFSNPESVPVATTIAAGLIFTGLIYSFWRYYNQKELYQ